MEQTNAILDALKRLLREQHLTYLQVAMRLNVSEATVKRWFSNRRLTLSRVEEIAAIAGFSMTELIRQADQRPSAITALTEAQEEELLADKKLFMIAFLAVNGWDLANIVNRFSLGETEVIERLAKLDRLGMIELLPGNRFRRRVARNFTWRRNGPVEAWFVREIQRDFMASRFLGELERYRFVGGLLSADAIKRMHRVIDRATREMDDLLERDSALPIEEKESVAAVLAIRPWEAPAFRQMKRD